MRALVLTMTVMLAAGCSKTARADEGGREGTRVRRCAPVPREDDPEKALKRFPPADKGMVRHVIRLDKQADESVLRVELIVGKTVKKALPSEAFTGEIVKKPVPGTSYHCYVTSDLGDAVGWTTGRETLVERFVALKGDAYLIPYGSPVVVYVPEGAEVRYRIWRTQPKAAPAPKG
jgi:ecotin